MVPLTGDTTRTLVVDDDELVRTVLRTALERLGHVVAEAGDGEAAIRATGTDVFDLVIIDSRMPGLSLGETLEGIRAALDPHHPGVLVISGAPVAVEVLEEHGAAYLAKPVDLREFLSAVRLAVAS